MTSAKMDSSTSFSSLHGSGIVVPLTKADAHPLEMLGSSNRSLTLNTESTSGTLISPSTSPPRRRYSRRRSISDGDRYMLMADQHQMTSERSLVSTESTTGVPRRDSRRKSLDAQCVAELKVQLAEHQAQADETALLISQLNADKDLLRALRDKALEKCKQLECDITRQKKEYEDKISRLEAQLEAQEHELQKIRLERDEMVEVASRRGSMASVASASAASSPPHVNRRSTLQAMHERRRSMQHRRSSNETEESGGRLTSSASRGESITSQGSHASGRWSGSDLSHHNSVTSVTSSRQESVRRARASITESIGEVGASIRDLMAQARDVAGGTANQNSLSPEDLLWMSDSDVNVGDLDGITNDKEDDVEDHPRH